MQSEKKSKEECRHSKRSRSVVQNNGKKTCERVRPWVELQMHACIGSHQIELSVIGISILTADRALSDPKP